MSRKEYIGKKIAEARKKKRMTQKNLSAITGIDKTSISKIEKGKINVTIETLDKICNAVGYELRFSNFKIFEDLVFEKHDFHKLADAMGESFPNYEDNKTCYQARMKFSNGLNISVLIGTLFYSNGIDTYEVCLWSDTFELIVGYKTDGEVNVLMEYAQMVNDVRFLELLQQNEFEEIRLFSFIKKIGKWWVLVNPVGESYFAYNTKPSDFNGSTFVYCGYDKFAEILPNMESFIESREADKKEHGFYING